MLQQSKVALHVVVELRQMHRVHVETAGTRLGVILEATAGHLFQVFAREASTLPDHSEEIVGVARGEEGQIALADGNVVGRRVGVELLMPLLDELALDAWSVPLLDAMCSHDVQDPVTDGITSARVSSGACPNGQPQQGSDGRARCVGDRGGHATTQGLLAMRHVLRLVASLAVPLQGLLVREAQDRGHPGGLVGREWRGPSEEILHHAEALELGPVAVLRLGVAEGLADLLAIIAVLSDGRLEIVGERDAEVAARARLQPALGSAQVRVKHEGDGSWGRRGREGQDAPCLVL
mmetsp:Transcript_31425/g.67491  ORF Transcript_31425/g.67491 Transcript_31425/m.67491 type:complete len:293 (+) Transcript_31425:2320-3198(+)